MGKNHRHSKKLKSEKAKVHIKTKTKFLPKGQNVTNTAFKIKPIVLQEQLKEREESGLVGKKRANINDLIPKLKHFNDSVKIEACQDIKDLIISNPLETVQVYLSVILQNTSALIQDRERKVRRSSIKLVHAILEKANISIVRPFFNYILTNLKCAMTNINKHIQEDSLLLLDALLEHQSTLIAENFDSIFPTFLTLISKSKNNITQDRSLSLNLEGKVTSVKWRVKVLTRLHGILHAMTQNRSKNTEKSGEKGPIVVSAQNTTFIPLYQDVSLFEKCNLFSKTENLNQEFDVQIVNLVQLLHEIWMEVVPEKAPKRGFSESTVLTTEESVAILSCTVHILHLLLQYLENQGHEKIFGDQKTILFLDQLMSNFPYSHNRKNNFEIVKDFSSSFVLRYDQNCVEENLLAVYLFITLKVKNLKHKSKIDTVGPYLNRCLKSPKSLSPACFPHLLKIFKEIFLKNPKISICQRLGINESELMENIANFYSNLSNKSDLLEILTSPRFDKNQSWIENMPDFLCSNQISAKLIEAVLNLCKKGHKNVQEHVKNNLGRILGNLPSVDICEVGSNELARKNFASIFFYLPELSSEDLEVIRDFIRTNSELDFAKYIENVLDLRMYMGK